MSQIISLNAVPNQTLLTPVGNQNCRLSIFQTTNGMFMDVLVDEEPIIQGVLCLDRTLIVRDGYLGFIGDLMFIDTEGTNDPDYAGLGTRYALVYLEAAEVPNDV
jgi:hypothetical protein